MNLFFKQDKKILVLGLSKSGVSAAKFLRTLGVQVWLSEYSDKLDDEQKKWVEELKKAGVKVEYGAHSDKFIDGAEVAVISPGISPSTEICKRLK